MRRAIVCSLEKAMSNTKIVSLALSAMLVLTACEGGGFAGMSKGQTTGTVAGTAAGALAGYLITGGTAGTLIGAAAGAVIGNRLGNYLEGDEKDAAAYAAVRAAEVPTGERVTWKKTGATFQTSASGWASPTSNAYQDTNGRTCRPIHQWATKNNTVTEGDVTLCKGTSGWAPA